jgi:hypothetical protein
MTKQNLGKNIVIHHLVKLHILWMKHSIISGRIYKEILLMGAVQNLQADYSNLR